VRGRQWITGFFIICLFTGLSANAGSGPSFRSYLTAEGGKNLPAAKARDDFECSDTIYIVVEVTAPVRQKPSDHVLTVDWFNPGNRL